MKCGTAPVTWETFGKCHLFRCRHHLRTWRLRLRHCSGTFQEAGGTGHSVPTQSAQQAQEGQRAEGSEQSLPALSQVRKQVQKGHGSRPSCTGAHRWPWSPWASPLPSPSSQHTQLRPRVTPRAGRPSWSCSCDPLLPVPEDNVTLKKPAKPTCSHGRQACEVLPTWQSSRRSPPPCSQERRPLAQSPHPGLRVSLLRPCPAMPWTASPGPRAEALLGGEGDQAHGRETPGPHSRDREGRH